MKVRSLLLFLTLFSCQSLPPEESTESTTPIQLFTLVSPEHSKVNFVNIIKEDAKRNIFAYEYFYNGGGVAILDINNDKLPDLFFTGNMVEDKLFLNKGNFVFEDITAYAGVGGGNGWSTGVTIVDINNDGYDDIYVSRSGGYSIPEMRANLLFINNKDNRFIESAESYGLNDMGYSTQAVFFDYDNDNDLDMYLVNHPIDFTRPNGIENREPTDLKYCSDKLYQNDGNNHFIEVTKSAGLENDAFGLGVCISDVNNDGYLDIYVSNDYIEPDFLYINNGDGTFTETIKEATKHISNYGMGVDIADFNNDGYTDIMVLDMVAEDYKRSKTLMGAMDAEGFWKTVESGNHYQYMRNTLQLNNANGTFSEIAQLAGVSNTDWSWAPLFADFDNDGFKDLFITNGYKRDVSNRDFEAYTEEAAKAKGGQVSFNLMEILQQIPSVKLSNYVFANNRDLTFSNKSSEWGLTQQSFSNGAAYADLDLDGDLDLVINNINDYPFIYKNNSDRKDNNYLNIEITAKIAEGSRITIYYNGEQQMSEYNRTRGYLSSVGKVIHFGLGNIEIVDSVTIDYPNGYRESMVDVKANQTVWSYRKNARPHSKVSGNSARYFVEISGERGLNFVHEENEYDDFERELLLPAKHSNHGPALAIGDVNGDGYEDIYIGGASGFEGTLFTQNSKGEFSKAPSPAWSVDKKCEDVDAVFFDSDNDGDLDLYVVSGGNEFTENSSYLQDRLYLNDGNGIFKKSPRALPEMLSSGSCVKPADYDQDGDLDLFVGGRVIPGKYPFSPRSYLLENKNGIFTDATNDISSEISTAGMVTDAVWIGDLDGGYPDLILVGEWMPITYFDNDKGEFIKVKYPGLAESSGWWNCIEAADFDGDGDLDLIVGNLGSNSKYTASPSEPMQVYCDDFDKSGSLDIVLAQFFEGNCYPVRGRECSSEQMPFIAQKFPSYAGFAEASLNDIFGRESLSRSKVLKAHILHSVYVENLGDDYLLNALPSMAQLSPIQDILIRDINSDGNLDAILVGNSYSPEVETGRYDAGTGLVLLGSGKGQFSTEHSSKTGLFTALDARKAKLILLPDSTSALIIANNNSILQSFLILAP